MFFSVLKFIFSSTNQHGVHSPFVYQLVTKCIYQKSITKVKVQLLKFKSSLKANTSIIKVLDLGSGSKKMNQHQRSVANILKTAAIPNSYALLLNRLVDYLKVKNVLELGTSLGSSTYAMSFNNNIHIDTIEGCPQTLEVAKTQFKKFNILEHVTCYNGEFSTVLNAIPKDKKFDLVFFDGNHQKQTTINYFHECLTHKHNNTVFVFDDIYWTEGMKEAWAYIKNHSEVTVTVDLFKLGLVFFRTEQVKEHFKIRFWK